MSKATYRTLRYAAAFLMLFATACNDAVAPSATLPVSPRALVVAADGDVPERGADTPLPTFATLSDSELWNAAVPLDTIFAVGLKKPGERRGFYQNAWRVTQAEWVAAHADVAARHGIRVLYVDSLLPMMRVKIDDVVTLAKIRRLPFIDYVEPAFVPRENLLSSGDGCDYSMPDVLPPQGPSGDYIPRSFTLSLIDQAWQYSNGSGVRVGVVDAGIDIAHPDFGANFTSGESGGRTITRFATPNFNGQLTPACTHGTRLASVVASPKNGEGIMGVAWKSDLVGVRMTDIPVIIPGDDNAANAFEGLRIAGNNNSRVITMAWGTPFHYDVISDEIDRLYNQKDVVFVAAAGTSPADLPDKFIVVFPGSKSNVITVSSADFGGTRDNKSHYGSALDVVAYQKVTTAGQPGSGTLSTIENSSAATGVVAGVAALVRSRYPTMTSAAVMARIKSTAGAPCGIRSSFGPIVNGLAAVGGVCASVVSGSTALSVPGDGSVLMPYSVDVSQGIGPLKIEWSNGQTQTIPGGAAAPVKSTAQVRFYPQMYGTRYLTSVWVRVTDLGHPNQAATSRSLDISVLSLWPPGTGGDCVPSPTRSCPPK